MTTLVRADDVSIANAAPPRHRREDPFIARVVTRARDEVGWDERHRALSGHPVFVHCGRQQIRWLVRRGEFVHIDAGELVWEKDRVARWLLVIFTGEVELRTGRRRESVGPAGHVGGELILAFAPTPATVRTVTPVNAFALNREHLLGVAHLRSIRAGLGLPLDDVTYRDDIRRLRAEADCAWRRLGASGAFETKPAPFPPSFRLYPRAPRRGSTPALFLDVEEPMVRAAHRPARRTIALIAAAALFAILVGGFTYRPPVAVARPGRAIDITNDVTVEGAATYPVHGRYLLLPVVYDDSPLIPLIWAVVNGERPVRWADEDEVAAGRAAYAQAQASAVRSALAATGHDPAQVRITFRERDLVGGSAGLVYALVVADMLDPDDVSGGRTIAATGAVGDDGKVSAVQFVTMKSTSAARAGAQVLVIPGTGVPPELRRWRGEVVTAATVHQVRERLAR